MFHSKLGLLLAAGVMGCPAASARPYAFTILSVPGAVATYPVALNDVNSVVGYYDDSAQRTHAYLYRNGIFRTLDIPGAKAVSPAAINNDDEIVGSYTDARGLSHGFILNGKWLQSVDYKSGGTRLVAITDSGVALGNADHRVFIYRRGVFTFLPIGDGPLAAAISKRGKLAGNLSPQPPHYEASAAFTYFHSKLTVINSSMPYEFLYVAAINAAGTVVGAEYTEPFTESGFIYRNGNVTSVNAFYLPAPCAYKADVSSTRMSGVNERGVSVGSVQADTTYGIVIPPDGTCFAIRVPGGSGTTATAINDAGVILGSYSANGSVATFLATPQS